MLEAGGWKWEFLREFTLRNSTKSLTSNLALRTSQLSGVVLQRSPIIARRVGLKDVSLGFDVELRT